MILNKLYLKGSFTISLDKIEDERGFFARYYCTDELKNSGIIFEVLQINNSFNKYKGTIRGLHFQKPPKAEKKIVRCINGAIWDVIVDLRKGSKTFGKWYGTELSSENRLMMYVPEGFAHGFQTLSDNTEIIYLHSEFYSKKHEDALLYNDEKLLIDWPIRIENISKKDKKNKRLIQIEPLIV